MPRPAKGNVWGYRHLDLIRRGFQVADFQLRHAPLWRRIVRFLTRR